LSDPIIATLAKALFDRRHEGVSVEAVTLEGGDWQPAVNQYHQNVAQWLRFHPEHNAVRGWWCSDNLVALLKCYEFFAHSVVETETGELIDFTPNPLPWRYPFIRHSDSDGEFTELVEVRGITKVAYQLRHVSLSAAPQRRCSAWSGASCRVPSVRFSPLAR
jgi:hypothetical protein